jgi:hypothetical protein
MLVKRKASGGTTYELGNTSLSPSNARKYCIRKLYILLYGAVNIIEQVTNENPSRVRIRIEEFACNRTSFVSSHPGAQPSQKNLPKDINQRRD